MNILRKPREGTKITCTDLYLLNDSAAINVLDMIDAGEVSKDDARRITELYWAAGPEHTTGTKPKRIPRGGLNPTKGE